MRIVARCSEFVHIPEDDGAWAIHWCDVEEVVQSGVHTRGVRIVGIGNDLIATCGGDELRTAVAGCVVGECLVDLLGCHIEVQPDGDGC